MICKARTKDFEDVFRLLCQLWPNEQLSKEKARILFTHSLNKKSSVQLILKDKGKIIGYSGIIFEDDFQVQGKVAYLSHLIIDREKRNKRFGTRFVKEILKLAKKCGCKEVHIVSSFKRKRAHTFYTSHGFHKTAYFFWKEL